MPPAYLPGETIEVYIERMSPKVALGLLVSVMLGALALVKLWTLCNVDLETVETICGLTFQ